MSQRPTRIGRFDLIRQLGQGGMGVLYLARDPVLGREVAIKLLHLDNDEARRRFEREARTAAGLLHPNIVVILDVGTHEGEPFIAMEYIPGETLAEVIARRPSWRELPLARRLELVESLCEGLQFAHTHDVVHRDVKPGNLIIGATGLKILDFGIAHVGDSELTQTGTMMGTVHYMSPEQIEGRAVDHRSDIFSVGAVLYEVLSYRRAFPGNTPHQVVLRIMTGEPGPLPEIVPGLDPALYAVVHRALRRRPEDRYQDLGAMRADLSRIRAGLGAPGEAERGLSDPTPPPTPPRASDTGSEQRGHPHGDEEGRAEDTPTMMVSGALAADGPAGLQDGTVLLPPSSDAGARTEEFPDVRLVIVRSQDSREAGRAIDIATSPFTLGRSHENALAIGDPGWSRTHASIEFVDGSFSVRDLGSSNGTYVNGRRVKGSEPLYFGATISIGGTVLAFCHGQGPTLPDLTGREINGRYLLQRRIRESAKAVMYAADDRNIEAPVAIKLLSPELVRFAGYREQFVREAHTAAQLQHPHICRVLDFGTTDVALATGSHVQTHFLCYELMPGGNLADRLEHMSGLVLDQIEQWIEMLGSALSYAHAQGVVHADLKPTAVVFDAAGHPYLTDFAIAQQSLSGKGQPVVGSPSFIAPEQWEGGPVTPLTDQFGFAALAYYMLTGAKPYEGLDNPDVRAVLFRRGPELAHEAAGRNGRPGFRRAVSDVLRKGLATAPEERHASVDQFTRALVKALGTGDRIGDAARVFVSYDRALSGGWARYFADKLRDKHGMQVFMDTIGLDRAGRFPPRLAKAIEDCDVFICFLAAATLNSKWVNEEIRLAHEHRKLMIPVFQESYDEGVQVDAGSPVAEMMTHQGIKLFDVSGHYVDHAVTDLANLIRSADRDD